MRDGRRLTPKPPANLAAILKAAGVTMLGSGTAPQSLPARSGRPRKRRVVSEATNVAPGLVRLTEAQFSRIVRAELARLGFTVWMFPIMKRTMAGVPDLTFFNPRLPGRLWAWELKRERGGVVSPAQRAAIDHLTTVPGVDARIVKPSAWPDLRDALIAAVLAVRRNDA